jgi:esterase/lipase
MKRIYGIIILMSVILTCCVPRNKEQYIMQYKEFVEEVTEQCGNYTKKDWEKADKRFEKFNTVWYQKFKDELSLMEKLTITQYKLTYSLLYAGREIGKIISDKIDDEYDELHSYFDDCIESMPEGE